MFKRAEEIALADSYAAAKLLGVGFRCGVAEFYEEIINEDAFAATMRSAVTEMRVYDDPGWVQMSHDEMTLAELKTMREWLLAGEPDTGQALIGPPLLTPLSSTRHPLEVRGPMM